MTDFDKEFYLLSEWLKYRIGWMTDHLLNWSPKAQLERLRIQGIIYVRKNRWCLTFEEWKQFNQTK